MTKKKLSLTRESIKKLHVATAVRTGVKFPPTSIDSAVDCAITHSPILCRNTHGRPCPTPPVSG